MVLLMLDWYDFSGSALLTKPPKNQGLSLAVDFVACSLLATGEQIASQLSMLDVLDDGTWGRRNWDDENPDPETKLLSVVTLAVQHCYVNR